MGHLDVVEKLIKEGADVTVCDENGLTALLWASDRGHVEVVGLLLSHSDLNAADKNGHSALHRAVNEGHLLVVEVLLAAGADRAVKDQVSHCQSQPLCLYVPRALVPHVQLYPDSKPTFTNQFSYTPHTYTYRMA
jgi:ankyrin repeat protein